MPRAARLLLLLHVAAAAPSMLRVHPAVLPFAGDAFDVIVAADVVAVPYLDAFDALIDTFQALSDPHTVILLAYTKRHFSEETFFVKLAQRGFACIALPATEVHADFRGDAHPCLFCVQQRKSIHRDLAE